MCIFMPKTQIYSSSHYQLCNTWVTTQLSLQEVVQIVDIYPIYHALGQNSINALIGFHARIGCNITGRIFGKSKPAWWNAFSTGSENVIKGLTELGVG